MTAPNREQPTPIVKMLTGGAISGLTQFKLSSNTKTPAQLYTTGVPTPKPILSDLKYPMSIDEEHRNLNIDKKNLYQGFKVSSLKPI